MKQCFRWGQSLHQQLPHQQVDSSTQPCRAPTIHLGSTGPNIFLSQPGPQQHMEPLHQALPSLGTLGLVSTESGHSHPRPTPKSAATTANSSCQWTAWYHPPQLHGWHLLQQSRIGHPPSHGASAIWFIDSYQFPQFNGGYSYPWPR